MPSGRKYQAFEWKLLLTQMPVTLLLYILEDLTEKKIEIRRRSFRSEPVLACHKFVIYQSYERVRIDSKYYQRINEKRYTKMHVFG